jgi:probable O-glycosylation ligase (exosortase A-associated)
MINLRLLKRWQQAMLAMALSLFITSVWFYIPHPTIAVLALLPLLTVISLHIPFVLCLTFIAFSFFRLHEVFPVLYPLHIPQLLAVATLSSLLINLSIKRIKMYWTRELALFSFFFVLVTIGALLATNTAASMKSFTQSYIKISAMVFAISWLLSRESQFRLLIATMTCCGICLAVVALFNKVNGLEMVEGSRVTIGRSIGSILGDPNDLSLVLLFPASFALALILTPGFSKLWKLLGIMCFISVCAAIIATQSRGGLLGICAVSGIFAWHRIHNKALLIFLGGIFLSLLFVFAGVSERASGGAHEAGIDESAMGRIYAWQAAMGMALSYPLTGVGLNNFIYNYFEFSPHWDGRNHAVHSTWFGVMAETGLLGLLTFIAMIVLIARISIRSVRLYSPNQMTANYNPTLYASAQSIQAGLAGFCVSGTFLTMGFTWPIYILLALAVALSQVKNLP